MFHKFPDGFLIGGAISACQAEGASTVNGKSMTFPETVKMILPEERKTFGQAKITEDTIREAKSETEALYPKRWGIDFYHTYKKDIALFAEMGFTVFRFSISIARVFPQLDQEHPNENALKHYEEVIDTCRKYGMEPLVTLAHFDPPLEMYEKYGGWSNRELIGIFTKYTKAVMERFKDQVKYWIIFNEINMCRMAPFKSVAMIYEDASDYEERIYKAVHNQFIAAAKTIETGKKINPQFQFGCMIADICSYPYSCDPRDVLYNQSSDRIMNLFFLDVQVNGEYPYYMVNYFEKNHIHIEMEEEDMEILKKNTSDFVGFSYYMSTVTSYDTEGKEKTGGNLGQGLKNPKLESTEWGWQIDPVGIRYTMHQLYDRYQKPLFILENGIGMVETLNNENTVHDQYRIEYLRDHMEQIILAAEEGCDVLGYTMWSPIDLISSGTSEMSKRYGFIFVDQDDFGNGSGKRYKKDSFHWFKKVISEGGLEI